MIWEWSEETLMCGSQSANEATKARTLYRVWYGYTRVSRAFENKRDAIEFAHVFNTSIEDMRDGRAVSIKEEN